MISHAPVNYNLTIDYSEASRFLHGLGHGSVHQTDRRTDLNYNALLISTVFSV